MDLVPGIEIVENGGLSEDDLLKQEIALQTAEAADIIANRKVAILTEVGMALHKGIAVKITDEMRELGLELRIYALIQEAEYYYQLNKFLMSEDDDFQDEGMELGL